MSYSFDGTNDFLRTLTAPVTAAPLTISLWVKATVGATDTLASLGVNSASDNKFEIILNSTARLTFQARDTAANDALTANDAGGKIVTDTWHHVCARAVSATERYMYAAGVAASRGSNTTSCAPTGIDSFRLGETAAGSNDFAGKIAHVAIWDIALSEAEILGLAGGDNPLLVQVGNLVAYWPLVADANDDAGSNNLTASGATLDGGDNPTIDPPTPAPTFSVSPTVTSQTASAYTIGYTADANATNIYVGSYVKDATAPTAAELKAGTGAHGTATEATTGSGDSIALTPSESTKFPVYDVYAVLEGAGGFSSVVALVDEMLDPPAGKQFVTLASVSGTSPLTGASPAVVAGDIWVLDGVSTPGSYTITATDTGDFSIAAGADENWQSFVHDVYDVSLGAYYGTGTVYVNYPLPVLADPSSAIVFAYPINVAITSFDLRTLAVDGGGNALVATIPTTPPTGLSVGSSALTGTPTVRAISSETIRWTNVASEYLEASGTFIIGQVDVPDVDDAGTSQATAVAAIEAAYLASLIEGAYSATIPTGEVISQDPVPGTDVDPYSAVTLTVSLGEEPVATSARRRMLYIPPKRSGTQPPTIQAQIARINRILR